MSLGTGIHHIVCDGLSSLHFINTWSKMARGGFHTAITPYFDRTLLRARDPPQPKFMHMEFQPPPALISNKDSEFAIFKLNVDQLNKIKAKAKGEGDDAVRLTSYEALAAHIWRCACRARGLPDEQETWLNVVFDFRSRLKPPLPQGYFGNAILVNGTPATYGELRSEPLPQTASRIKETVARMDDEYVRSAIDYLELQPEPDIKTMRRGPHTFGSPNMGVTSWVRLPVYEADFGWGRPIFMGPAAIPFEGQSYLLSNPENDGSLSLAISLQQGEMDTFNKLLYDISS